MFGKFIIAIALNLVTILPVSESQEFRSLGCDTVAIILDKEGLRKDFAGDHRGSMTDFDAALRTSPNCASAYNNRGTAKCHLNELKGCLDDYNRAIELEPKYFAFYNNRGLARGRLCDYQGALEDYDFALKEHPFFAEALGNKAALLMATFHDDEAVQLLEKAIALKPALKPVLEREMEQARKHRDKPCSK